MLHSAKFNMLEVIKELLEKSIYSTTLSLLPSSGSSTPPYIVLDLDETKHNYNDIVKRKVIELSPHQDTSKMVILFNSLARSREQVVSVLVSTPNVRVLNSKGEPVESQLNPVWRKNHLPSTDQYQLYFRASLPPLGIHGYTIQYTPGETPPIPTISYCNANTATNNAFLDSSITRCNLPITIENSFYKLTFEERSGMMEKLTFKASEEDGGSNKESVKLKENYLIYSTHKSGAYLFLPTDKGTSLVESKAFPFQVIRGDLVQEVVHLDLPAVPKREIRIYPTGI